MIFVKLLSGPFFGEAREIPEDVSPMNFFRLLVQKNWDWRTEYSAADDEEIFHWLRAEIVARIVRALEQNRPVSFMGRSWKIRQRCDLARITQQIEDAIVASGRNIALDSDDEKGLIIGVRGFEQ
jgi:hypothetical protein